MSCARHSGGDERPSRSRRRGVQEAPQQEHASQHHPRARRQARIFQYLFAKQDRANIDDDELRDFRTLAKAYSTLSDDQLATLLRDKDLMEICL